jgi:D-alanyl-D-alanine carboxypeptidase/D-alanyl-D-alanine-endopeptidase (penicillin-binding protein 4)
VLFTLLSSNLYADANDIPNILRKAGVNKNNVGIYVYDLNDKKPVYSLNEERSFSIASVNKLFITAAAIKLLGQDFRFKTSVCGQVPDDKGVVTKPLYIKGGGDPIFVSESMWYLVNRLSALGIKTINGDIVLDDTLFPAEEIYEETDDRAYSAKISSLSVNFNSIALSVVSGQHSSFFIDPPIGDYGIVDKARRAKSQTDIGINRIGKALHVSGNLNNVEYNNKWIYRNIDDPFVYFGDVLKLHLKWRGITFNGKIVRGKTPEDTNVLFDVESRRLSEIIMEMNKFSNNFIAEQTIRALACKVSKKCDVKDAIEAVLDYLDKQGLDRKDFEIVNASGYSRSNKSKPKSFVKFLEKVYDDFEIAPEFMNSLSIAGIDGTIRRSIREKEFKGRLRAKTGTLTGVRSLAGYFYSDNHIYAFIIVANDPNAHKLLDYEGKILQNIK